MDENQITLNDILDLDEWQKLQDALAMATRLAMVTSDYKGTPFTRGSNCSQFCVKARAHPQIFKYCLRCDSIGGLEAAKRNAPYIYTCHLGITDLAVPIIVGRSYIGALIAGQIRIADQDPDNMPERLLVTKRTGKVAEFLDENHDMYDGMPSLTMEEIYYASMALYHVCRYATGQRTNAQTCEIGAPGGLTIPDNVLSDSRPTCGNPPPSVKEPAVERFPCDHVLRPAFEYIFGNRQLFPSMKQMAELCRLSPSYFSRLFKRETGQPFTEYLSGLKIEWSKQLLGSTELSVADISEQLGYSSPSYFTKSFRDREHITPHAYRSLLKK